MSDCSENKNPLQRSGTSQLQRLLPGLSAGYAQVDENGFDNWIVFAAQFARYINYYEQSDTTVVGNWEPFFNSDISALLGSVAVQDVDIYKVESKKRFDFLKDDDNKKDTDALKRNLSELFASVFTLAKAMDGYLVKLTTHNGLNTDNSQQIGLQLTLLNMVKTKLAPSLQRLIGYYKAASSAPLNYVSGGAVANWQILNTTVTPADTIINQGLSLDWCIFGPAVADADKTWAKYVQSINADDSIFKTPVLSPTFNLSDGSDPDKIFQRINHAANHNLFAAVFDQFLMVYSRIINEAEKELLKTLEVWDSHPPHYALFLTFLKLFRHAQDSMNTLTQRHLDYYYKEVLQIKPQEATPSHAHVLVELAKQTDAWVLSKNEQLKAGKDTTGKDILFTLDKEESFNKAAVAAFKSVYIGTANDNHGTGGNTVNNTDRMFASPIANSADGLGAALTTENKEWHPFVDKIYSEAKLVDIAMPNAQIGFAVASHYLYLTEGKRKVRLRLFNNKINDLINGLKNNITCLLTVEKTWYEVPVNSIKVEAGTMQSGKTCAEINFTLPGDAPAVIDYQAKVHGGTFTSNLPLLKIILKNEDTNPYNYKALRDMVIEEVEVKVEVGMDTANWNQDGLKALQLSNDTGPVDAAKPFPPFGAQPKKDTTFVIGHKEPFSKKDASIRLHLKWANLPASANNIQFTARADSTADAPVAKINFLAGGVWAQHSTASNPVPETANIFDGVTETVVMFGTAQKIPATAIKDYTAADELYNTQSKNGFMRLVLGKDFGYKSYLSDLSLYLIGRANGTIAAAVAPPVEPYSPILQSVYLSYAAQTTSNIKAASQSDFKNRQVQFFHIGPFGEAEQHAVILKAEQPDTTVYLLPQFTHTGTGGAKMYHQGEFYIGLQNIAPQQAVSLLFQVLEGSADPQQPKPDKHVYWSYLGKNQWYDFETKDVSDATRQLVQSGIIHFTIPANAATAHTILPTGYIWLRASVENYAEAVCALLDVHTQAAPATLFPNNNADGVLSSALPTGSITKLKTPAAAVKKIIQPYPGFGGKAKENDVQFYTRVSERLRHKARAITIWDYEHIVLQAFPQIHKVKCLNHTQVAINKATQKVQCNEIKPGHVTIITIPSLINRNDVNPLKPYTNQSLLLEIKEYLQQKISCHVKLEVANPEFEEVRLSFKLKLAQGYTDFTYYSKQLKQEITNFLTPWAFNNQAEVQFGGMVYKSSLINFIEERYYVEYITDVNMFHKISGKSESANLEEIVASTGRSILVSAQASTHQIEQAIETAQSTTNNCNSVMAS